MNRAFMDFWDYEWLESDFYDQARAEESDEFRLLEAQHRARWDVEDQKRQQLFEIHIYTLRDAFIEQEIKIRSDRRRELQDTLKRQRIQGTRDTLSPAYTFTKFRELPTEIQDQIWAMCAVLNGPQVYSFVPAKSNPLRLGLGHNSSRVTYSAYRDGKEVPSQPVPVVLKICKSSRAIGLRIFSRIHACRYNIIGDRPRLPRDRYYNTVIDTFYVSHGPWIRFKILADLLLMAIGREAGRLGPSQEASVHHSLTTFRNIPRLAVDLATFSQTPMKVWTMFSQLESLSIVIYPAQFVPTTDYKDIDAFEAVYKRQSARLVDYSHLQSDNCKTLRRRTTWLATTVRDTLQEFASEVHITWKVPSINVLVRHFDSSTNVRNVDGQMIEDWFEIGMDRDELLDDEDEEASIDDLMLDVIHDQEPLECDLSIDNYGNVPRSEERWYQEAVTMVKKLRSDPDPPTLERFRRAWNPQE